MPTDEDLLSELENYLDNLIATIEFVIEVNQKSVSQYLSRGRSLLRKENIKVIQQTIQNEINILNFIDSAYLNIDSNLIDSITNKAQEFLEVILIHRETINDLKKLNIDLTLIFPDEKTFPCLDIIYFYMQSLEKANDTSNSSSPQSRSYHNDEFTYQNNIGEISNNADDHSI